METGEVETTKMAPRKSRFLEIPAITASADHGTTAPRQDNCGVWSTGSSLRVLFPYVVLAGKCVRIYGMTLK